VGWGEQRCSVGSAASQVVLKRCCIGLNERQPWRLAKPEQTWRRPGANLAQTWRRRGADVAQTWGRRGADGAVTYSRPVLLSPAAVLQFGPFSLDLGAARLTRAGHVVALRPKAFDVLRVLAERPGLLVTKDELLDSVWGRRFVSESVIKAVVSELRLALADGLTATHWIETVPRRGYRFAMPPASADAVAVVAGAVVAPQLGNIPPALMAPIGREAELASLATLLQAHRLVTIAGPSGVGKTRLALACAVAQGPRWREGVWFVELAPRTPESTDTLALCTALAHTLGLAAAARDSAALAATLRPLQLLLVVDNAEHLLAPLAPLLGTLLAQAPGLRVLVTSQEPLHIAAEHVFRLAPLDVPHARDDGDITRLMASGAMRLFLERAAARQPGFSLGLDQHALVASICRALDGLPLALELAAARVPVLGVQGIAGLLSGPGEASNDERLQLLNNGQRDAVARQSSLRNALQWSHALLDDAQRRVFRRLSVFRGGFSLLAAQAVCADDRLDRWGVLDALDGLVDKSLVVSTADAEGGTRFMLLGSPRSFALERLHQAGEEQSTQQRHLHAQCQAWCEADAQVFATPALVWLARHRADVDNLRAALQFAGREGHSSSDAEAALALVVHARMLWSRAGLVAEGHAWCEAVRGQASRTTDAALQRGFEMATVILAMYGNAYPRSGAALGAEQLAQRFLQAGEAELAYHALYMSHQLRVWAGQEAGDSSGLIAQMTALEQTHWSELLTRHGRMLRAYECHLAGDFEAYLLFCRDELARMRRLGALAESWNTAQGLMLAESDAGHATAALEVGRLAMSEVRQAGQLRQHTALAAVWTTLLSASGDSAGTRQALQELLPALHSAGTPWMAQVALAWLPASEGRWQAAARLLGWCQASQSPQRAEPSSKPGRTVMQAQQALLAHLTQHSASTEMAQWLSEGGLLNQAQAEQEALASAAPSCPA
jgi:predicted ATPase/DNA-binding winged helix-turn-helix (wHTH) protein